MPRLSAEVRTETIQRARQIISEHPGWGRHRVNRQLRSERGHGLRDSEIDRLAKPVKSAARMETPRLPPPDKITMRDQRRVLREAGFLQTEIARTEAGMIVKGLGTVLASTDHNQFRPVLEAMIRDRWLMRLDFAARADRYGWTRAGASRRWSSLIHRYYRSGSFPLYSKREGRKRPVLHPTSDGGGFVAAGGKISPWGLYHAYLAWLRSVDPFGGLGFDSPRPIRGGKTTIRIRTKRVIREHIRRTEEQLAQTEVSMRQHRQSGNNAAWREAIGVRNAQVERLANLKDELSKATR